MSHILFLDIETVSGYESLLKAPESIKDLFNKRYKNRVVGDSEILKDEVEALMFTHYEEASPLSAEFGKMVCYSAAYVGQQDGEQVLRVQTKASRNEKELLTSLSVVLEKVAVICGHNIKGFDLPFLFRRYLANGLPVPSCLNVKGKKPWEVPHVDTMEIWGHMEWKYRCSLELLAVTLGLPSPKSEITGADVGRLYWRMFDDVKNDELPFEKEKEVLDRIGDYCSRDVITVANVYNRLEGRPIFEKIVRI